MNQQAHTAIAVLDEMIREYDNKSYLAFCGNPAIEIDKEAKAKLIEAKSRIQELDLQSNNGWILWNDEKPVAKQLINMFNIHNGNINAGKVMQIEIDSEVPPYTHWMPISLPPNK